MGIRSESVKTRILLSAVLLFARAGAACAGLTEPEGHKLTRVAECFNSPAAQLLLMKLNADYRDAGNVSPAWQTLSSETAEDYERLDDVMVISAHDMFITGLGEYADKLERRGLARKKTPLWKERLILVGPADGAAEFTGMKASDIMKKAASENLLFFSRLNDDWARNAEGELWKASGADSLAENSGYVETGRDNLSALLQAGDEGALMLICEGPYAQYVDSERFEPALVKIADTDYFRVTYACLTSSAGFRKLRSEGAEKFLEWLLSPEGNNAISGFSIGGTNPFIPVR
jgi:tungstate transport system substrate-binding protein